MMHARRGRWTGTRVLTCVAIALVWMVSSGAPARAQPSGPVVTVAQPLAKRVTQWDEYSGRFEAVQHVDLRARVSGFVEKIHFKDGQVVKAGDLLFSLDKRPFALAVESARAEVTRFNAQVALADSDVDRAAPLAKSQTISQQVFQQREAALLVARAQLEAANTAVKIAELNLDWTDVRAPIDGRISDRKIDVGNLVAGGQAASTTVLATIVSQAPIHFVFDVSEADFLRYSRLYLSGERISSRDVSNPVRIKLADEKDYTHEGRMDFVDNALSPRSGTLKGRAVLANDKGLLQPGLFGRLQLFGGEFDALLVPDAAIVSDQARKLVFLVGSDDVVKGAPVELGSMFNGLRIVRAGLKATDRIVVNGLANPAVRPGAKVKPENGTIAVSTN